MTLPFKHDLKKIKQDKESDFWIALKGEFVWLEDTSEDNVSPRCSKAYFYEASSIKEVYTIYKEKCNQLSRHTAGLCRRDC